MAFNLHFKKKLIPREEAHERPKKSSDLISIYLLPNKEPHRAINELIYGPEKKRSRKKRVLATLELSHQTRLPEEAAKPRPGPQRDSIEIAALLVNCTLRPRDKADFK